MLGDVYLGYLKDTFPEAGDRTDLVAYFFRRAYSLLRKHGTCGLLATNTISQGDTRSAGLRWIRGNGGCIFDVRKRVRWPGQASVIVTAICIAKDLWVPAVADGRSVERLTAYLVGKGGDDDPVRMSANRGLRSEGFKLASNGFVFDDDDERASPIAKKDELLSSDARYEAVVHPYIGGEELNDDPRQSFRRWAINFGRMTEEQAAAYPAALDIVREKVKPYRDLVKRDAHRTKWWQYGETRPTLTEAMAIHKRLLCNSRLSEHLFFAFLPAEWILSERLNVFFFDRCMEFSLLQSRTHECWARFFGSTLEDRLLYTASDCFETFPFPANWKVNDALERIGDEYYQFRADLMVRNNEGLTKTYNRFHDKYEDDAEIQKLRDLHAQMDRAVLDAYGWTDLQPVHDFILDYEEPEEELESGKTRKKKEPWRYRWTDEFRDEVLARLLELNRQRAAEEKAERQAAEAAKPVTPTKARAKKKPKAIGARQRLPGMEEDE